MDGIVDSASQALSRNYLKRAGFILHHNVDKGLLIGGSSEVRFGYGKITRKIEIIVAGRATNSFSGKKIDVDAIVRGAARDYLEENTRFLDVDKEVSITTKLVSGSEDLQRIFARENVIPLANDTSFGVGFAPLSQTEQLVLGTENFLNSRKYKKRMPAVGEDIKVMGLRHEKEITLTIAIAFVARFVHNADEYFAYKDRVKKDVLRFAKGITSLGVDCAINTGDDEDQGEVYLTKSGLSCESGDDGQVGRGNRVNGLITPFRRMSMEAAAGKNPVSHVGKIYNIFANELAKAIVSEYAQVKECNVAVMSQIGRSIDKPLHLNIDIIPEKRSDGEALKGKIEYLTGSWLKNISDMTRNIYLGKYKTF